MVNTHTPVTTTPPFAETSCSAKEILERLGDRWTILVLAALSRRSWGFREMQRNVDGISQRMLTLTLRRLERDGLVSRTVLDTRPPKVQYALTDLGDSLTGPLRAVADWAEANRATIAEHQRQWDLSE